MSDDRNKLDNEKLSENDELETEENDVEAHSLGGDYGVIGDEDRGVLGDEVLGDGERNRLS